MTQPNQFPLNRGIGVAQGLGSDYPFLFEPSKDIAGLVADFYLTIDALAPDGDNPDDDDPVIEGLYQLPWRIYQLKGMGHDSLGGTDYVDNPHAVDVIVKDANSNIIFDTTTIDETLEPNEEGYDPNAGFSAEAFGPEITVFIWQSSAAFCRLAAYTTYDESETWNYTNNILPTTATLDPRTCGIMAKRVTSLIADGDPDKVADVKLKAGYNIDLTQESVIRNSLPVRRITVNAVPGAGLGLFDDCEPAAQPVRTINSVQPDQWGNFSLVGKDCVSVYQATDVVSVSPRTTIPSAWLDPLGSHLKIQDDCKACCNCDDYVDSANKLVGIYDHYAYIADELQWSRDTHNDNVKRWNDGKDCRRGKSLHVTLQPQGCPFIDVLAQYVNQSTSCQQDLILRIRGTSIPEVNSRNCTPEDDESTDDEIGFPDAYTAYRSKDVTIVPGSTSQLISTPRSIVPYTLQGNWCDYRAYWSDIGPFATVYVKFRLRFPYGGMPDGQTPYGMQIWVDGTVGGEWLLDANGNKLVVTASTSTRCGRAIV